VSTQPKSSPPDLEGKKGSLSHGASISNSFKFQKGFKQVESFLLGWDPLGSILQSSHIFGKGWEALQPAKGQKPAPLRDAVPNEFINVYIYKCMDWFVGKVIYGPEISHSIFVHSSVWIILAYDMHHNVSYTVRWVANLLIISSPPEQLILVMLDDCHAQACRMGVLPAIALTLARETRENSTIGISHGLNLIQVE
jgi:hypothetical protein